VGGQRLGRNGQVIRVRQVGQPPGLAVATFFKQKVVVAAAWIVGVAGVFEEGKAWHDVGCSSEEEGCMPEAGVRICEGAIGP
jgi:hypothetical protein